MIRVASKADIPQLQALQLEGWQHDYVGYMPEGYASIALQRYGTSDAIASNMDCYRYYFVAEAGEDVLGCITADLINPKDLELYWIHVAQRHRGKGVGRKLVEHLLARLEPPIQALYVTTFQGYTPTLSFYKALGFSEHEQKVAYYDGVAVNDIRLKRTVSKEEV